MTLENLDINSVIKNSKIHPSRIFNIYLYGSRVYQTQSFQSDWDFIIVANTSVSNQEIRSGEYNIHIITPDDFSRLLLNHKPNAIECFYLPPKFKLIELKKFQFNLNISSLRHSFSHTSSNSWVKARKKFQQGDEYLGLKSLFHSLRIPMFGIQICKFQKIVDYSSPNRIFENIFSREWDSWDELDSTFRPIRNQILSEFRSLSTK